MRETKGAEGIEARHPRINVQVAPRFQGAVDEEALRRAAAAALSHEGVEAEVELSLVVTDDETVRELNRRFRGVDAPTDVLAFGTGDEGTFVFAPDELPYLGDVVIPYPRARSQAEEVGHSVEDELNLLVVHGVLHLLGYDDQEEADARRMREREEAILRLLR